MEGRGMKKIDQETRIRADELQRIEAWILSAIKQYQVLTPRDTLDHIRERYTELWRNIKEKHK
jgi:hypothetical protein